jgi:hypothetical protein
MANRHSIELAMPLTGEPPLIAADSACRANTTGRHDRKMRTVQGCLFVTATLPIQTAKRVIAPGTHVLIASDVAPAKGQMVLVGSNLEPWNGQAEIVGVATMTYEDCADYQRGLRIAA